MAVCEMSAAAIITTTLTIKKTKEDTPLSPAPPTIAALSPLAPALALWRSPLMK